jgi:proton glutamate symport protein
MKTIPLHWQILGGMILGIACGSLALQFDQGSNWVSDWIKPFGTIFINTLKLLAIPLIIASLIKGVSDLKDLSSLSRLGVRTLGIYIATTFIAITVGLTAVNLIQPGSLIAEETRTELMASYGGEAESRTRAAEQQKSMGPLQMLIDLVPSNIFQAASSNGNMLQVIFFVIFFGIGMILIPEEKSGPVKAFFDALNEVILKLIDLVMLFAPYGVFALMAALVTEAPGTDIFIALGAYAGTVVLGLAFMLAVVYPVLLKIFTGKGPVFFLKGIAPAQLVAFSTSSSAATLPVTMERVEEHLGVDKQVTSFVCPVGATINMDGTSLYQAVAAVFIAQAFGDDVTFQEQLTIILTALLASIGSAAVPGAGLLMLVIVLESIGVNPAGIALIFAIDRPLDMLRTSVNVTSDAFCAMTVAKSVGKLGDPHVREWDDNYPEK